MTLLEILKKWQNIGILAMETHDSSEKKCFKYNHKGLER
jgi:hypothetical protein